jgi:ring-1,2-phenylacetyl-CoA epoxidase subunit PaaE
MSLHFHSLKIKEVSKETADCVAITFDVPQDLQNDFVFTQGQNLTLKTIINGEEVRRSYSICTAPYENKLTVAVKKVDGGIFSTYANTILQKGDVIDVMPPSGKFNTILNHLNKKNYLAIAAGSGITPILSIIKTTLQTEPQSTFTLVYSNKNKNSIIFFEEIEGLKNKYINRFNLINILSREKTDAAISFGRINEEKLAHLSKLINYKTIDDVFICGPEEMIFCAKDFFEKKGLDKKQIHFELFGTVKKKLAMGNEQLVKEKTTEAKSNITIKLDGRSFDFALGFNEGNILDAALAQGADLPYACKGGVCCTCKAKLLEGEVEMDVNWGLEHDEIEQGFILTCQSHPKTEKVVVDFDVK